MRSLMPCRGRLFCFLARNFLANETTVHTIHLLFLRRVADDDGSHDPCLLRLPASCQTSLLE